MLAGIVRGARDVLGAQVHGALRVVRAAGGGHSSPLNSPTGKGLCVSMSLVMLPTALQ